MKIREWQRAIIAEVAIEKNVAAIAELDGRGRLEGRLKGCGGVCAHDFAVIEKPKHGFNGAARRSGSQRFHQLAWKFKGHLNMISKR